MWARRKNKNAGFEEKEGKTRFKSRGEKGHVMAAYEGEGWSFL